MQRLFYGILFSQNLNGLEMYLTLIYILWNLTD